MQRDLRFVWSIRVLKWATVILILKVLVGILVNYADYFPPNFEAEFLLGREDYFFGFYCLAFYVHIVVTPLALVSGLVLLSDGFRRSFPTKHRWIGRLHVTGLLTLLVPSSLWMSAYANGGGVASAGFALLSLGTAACAGMGWRRARERDFKKHRFWMSRCFVMLCSAVVLRLISGAAMAIGFESEWTYPITAWAAWIVPLCVLELIERQMALASFPFKNIGKRQNGDLPGNTRG